jgi:hypothetical protein
VEGWLKYRGSNIITLRRKIAIKQLKQYSTAVSYYLEPGDRCLGIADIAVPESVDGLQILED